MSKKTIIITSIIILVILIVSIYLLKDNFENGRGQINEDNNIDLSECLSLQGDDSRVYSKNAFNCLIDLAKANKDPSICESGFKEQYMFDCYEDISQYFGDVALCDGLESTEAIKNLAPTARKFNCYIDFAAKKDWEICDNLFMKEYITDNEVAGSDFCYLTIVSRGNNLLGKSLTDDEIITLCGKIIDDDLGSSCLNYVGDPYNIPQS